MKQATSIAFALFGVRVLGSPKRDLGAGEGFGRRAIGWPVDTGFSGMPWPSTSKADGFEIVSSADYARSFTRARPPKGRRSYVARVLDGEMRSWQTACSLSYEVTSGRS